LKIKLKNRHFDTIDVIKAELQTVLNTLTEHNFKHAFKKNGRSAGNSTYALKGTTLRVMVVSRPMSDQMAAPVTAIMDDCFYGNYFTTVL
jgi:hypothetical protein